MLEKIGSLPLLEKFKMQGGCFGAGQWEICDGQFPSLKYLGLSFCDSLRHWAAEEEISIFPRLEKLHLSHLRGLENIPYKIGYISTLKSIQIENCHESVVIRAKEIVEEQMGFQGDDLSFNVYVELWRTNEEEAVLKELQSLSGPNFEVAVSKFF
ncbi:hypothetical protein SASPL_106947 [Salvia splendens]|uniref:Uncharacterized protein n=2 Tax=Salvia splendens TaxID=180675 RepID=A0A8X9A5A1_SALSN|nr:hypothetical protein SASPL_106947 [Salvia splendens]